MCNSQSCQTDVVSITTTAGRGTWEGTLIEPTCRDQVTSPSTGLGIAEGSELKARTQNGLLVPPGL